MKDPLAPDGPPQDSGPLERPDWVGSYRILDVLGQGGMGVVFLAEERGAMRRRVALKLIKRGMDTDNVLRRFDAERQTLALMEHENIAKVFYAGASEDGRPYFVMEYVRGIPVTAYCEEQRLGIRDRLEIFLQICAGVEHAHQKAVIHRDLKPSNVLVTVQSGTPVPKIIDFGLARATDPTLRDHTIYTEHGTVVGTPEYMSPEQAGLTALDIDTRSDVYALGALLYELLTGEMPFELSALRARGNLDAILRVIREVDPPTPSARVEFASELLNWRSIDTSALRRSLRGDLDWVTMKALEKDRTRRYQSASELAADIRRYLRDEPVAAGPPSTTYRLMKFVRRHRVGVITAAAIGLLLLLSSIAFSALWLRSEENREVADQQALRASSTKEFLRQMLWPDESDFLDSPREDIPLSGLLARSAELVETQPPDDPEVEAEIHEIIGMAYRSIWENKEALRHLARAHQLLERHLDPTSDRLEEVRLRYAILLENNGRLREAGRLLEAIYDARCERFGLGHPTTIHAAVTLASHRKECGQLDACEDLARRTLPYAEDALDKDSTQIGHLHELVGWCTMLKLDLTASERAYLKALQIARGHYTPDDSQVLRIQNNLAEVYLFMDRPEEALTILRDVWNRMQARYDSSDAPSLPLLSNLAKCHYYLGDFEDATRLWRLVAERRRATVPDAHDLDLLRANLFLSRGLHAVGKTAEAERLLRASLRAARSGDGRARSFVPYLRQVLGNVLLDADRPDEAAWHILSALESVKDAPLPVLVLASMRIDAAHALLATRNTERARSLLDSLRGHWAARILPQGLEFPLLWTQPPVALPLVRLDPMPHIGQGSTSERAQRLLQSALTAVEGKLPEHHRMLAKAREGLAMCEDPIAANADSSNSNGEDKE